jgi:Methylamine utilisation protein MauE
MLDPALGVLIVIAFAALYAQAAWHKLRAPGEFAAVLEAYALLPRSAAPAVARLLPLAELAVAVGLVVPGSSQAAALVASALLLLYALAMAINLARGRHELDCGCLGPYRRRRVSWWMVGRNGVLAATAALAALPRVPRPWSTIDAWTIAAGAIVAAVLYAAIDRLLAERPAPGATT